jgi:putative membrane protein insertion efficiency factor
METISQTCQKVASNVVIFLIKIYQYIISPLLGPRCRYYPSCSNYAVEALQVHGFFKGFYYSVRRLLRCHPFSAGGVDLVPPTLCQKHQIPKG